MVEILFGDHGKIIKRRVIVSKPLRLKIWNKFEGHCAYCGCEIELNKMQVDHIHAHLKGGECEENNFNPSCRRCNMWKGAMSIEDFRDFIYTQPKNLLRDRGSMRIAVDYGLVIVNEEKPVFYFEKFFQVSTSKDTL